MKRLGIWALLVWSLSLPAAEELDLWMRANAAKGRVQILATDALQLQKMAVWSERSLKQLEADWQTVLPFRQGQPLQIQVHPGEGAPNLQQQWRQRILTQSLHLSQKSLEAAPQKIAELFTQAMATRRGLAALPPNEQQLDWTPPDWLVQGSAHAMLSGRSPALFASLIDRYQNTPPSYPEQVKGQSDPATAALLCRWLFQQNPPDLWTRLARGDFRETEIWVALLPNIGNLRELHQHWDLWWLNEQSRLIADYGLQAAAEAQLVDALMFIPAVYGMSVEDLDRTRPIPFSKLEDYLDDPRFEWAMQKWVIRLQVIRFRQSPEFNLRVERLQQAGNLAIQAARSQGRKRERFWAEASARVAN